MLVRARGAAAAALVACLLPRPSLADARQDAKRHFRSGMALISGGQTERGVAELKQAYAIKPHPDILYNIARAYLDDGNVPEALVWFRKYVATNPRDRANVEAVIARLVAATRPPEPAPQAAQSSIDAQKLLAQLQEMIARNKAAEQPPAKPAEAANAPAAGGKPAIDQASAPAARPPAARPASAAKTSDEMFEPVAVTAETRATAREIAAALGGHADEAMFDDQPAAAARRTAQTPSATVLGDDEIRLSGAATIAELVRRLPGVEVDAGGARALVLVDGRSAYDELVGGTPWPLLNLELVDIARIEVLRGAPVRLPGGTVIGTVVNIVTRGSGDDRGRGAGQEQRTVQASAPDDR